MITLNTELAVVEIPQDGVFDQTINLSSPLTKQRIGSFHVHRGQDCFVGFESSITCDPQMIQDGLLSLSQYLIHREHIVNITAPMPCELPYSDGQNINIQSIRRHADGVPPVSVAIVMLMDEDGNMLMGKRPQGKYMPSLWEFPGGKIEAGETAEVAGNRELHEELGIEIIASKSIELLEYCFLHSRLEGHLRFCTRWKGHPQALHHEELRWIKPEDLSRYDMPLSAILSLPIVLDLV